MAHRLSRVISGVEFDFPTELGARGRALVVSEYLASRFGAEDDQASWLTTFARHRAELEAHAASLEQLAPVTTHLIVIATEMVDV